MNLSNLTYDPFMVVCQKTEYLPFANNYDLLLYSVLIFCASLILIYRAKEKIDQYIAMFIMIFSFLCSTILLINLILS